MQGRRLEPWVAEPGRPLIVAGPCAAESREQVLGVAAALARLGEVRLLRAGVWKPRTSPGGFEGVGVPALDWLVEARERHGLRPCVEVATPRHLEFVLDRGIDAVWIGARTTASPFAVQDLADALRGTGATVLVKNPLSPDLPLWLGALSRLAGAGVRRLVAVHRGFTSPASSRFRADPLWRVPLELRRRRPELPLLCDPSHMAGRRELVAGLAQAALDLGLDGLMVEVHPQPEAAHTDARQQLTPRAFGRLLRSLVRRSPGTVDAGARGRLAGVRQELDRTDDQILDLLARRVALAARLAGIKEEAGVIAFQEKRMDQVLRRWMDRSRDLGLPPHLAEEIYLTLHEAALGEQLRIMSKRPAEEDNEE